MSRRCRLAYRLHHAVRRWLGCPERRVSVSGPGFEFRNLLIDGETLMASTLTDGKRLKIKFGGQDRDGFPVSLPAAPAFKVDDPTLATVVPGEDGAALIVPVQPFRLGTVKVTGSVPGHPELGTLEYTVNLAAGTAARLVGDVEVVDDAPANPAPSTEGASEAKDDGHQVVS